MEFNVSSGHPEKQKTACCVVGIFEKRKLSLAARRLDEVCQGSLSNFLQGGDLTGKEGQCALLYNLPHLSCERVLLVGCGLEKAFKENTFRKAIQTAVQKLMANNIKEATFTLPELVVKDRLTDWKLSYAVQVICDTLYTFDSLKTKKNNSSRLKRMTLMVRGRQELSLASKAIQKGQAIAQGVALAKTLGNMPANLCTPTYLGEEAQKLCRDHPHMRCTILNEPDIQKLKMGAFLSVTKGSHEPPKLITVEYGTDKKDQPPIVLVGKGITFDSGGISLKPDEGMDEMKFDMCGAASVLGAILAAKTLNLPLKIIGIIPTCENLPGGSASRPGDIVTSFSGQTIEILNTDAEGRLILCDALSYSAQFKPDVVIDIATLTGACVVALGKHASGLFSNSEPLAKELVSAGKCRGDRAWQLPLWEDYSTQLDSNFADLANVGGREAGAITAACFLSRFTQKLKWAHLDIAGTAWLRGKEKGATGRPVPLLVAYLLNRCKKEE
ncbi:MAG: leucyl aminopeptidase [Gammaproteobacteria bacterium]|nr:leucyl aminopeptidase [Gammaproteobacteria bacterium]